MGHLDAEISEAVASLRFGAATWLFLLCSRWFVEFGVFLAVAGGRDVLRRARVPRTLIVVGIATMLASIVANGLKTVFDRPRPPLGEDPVTALTRLPVSGSFPSGHAATAFAAAVALGLLVPRLRVPALTVAALVAFSRVYLGVHYVSDVVAGGLIGAAIAAAVVYASSGFSGRSRARDSAPASPGRGSGRGSDPARPRSGAAGASGAVGGVSTSSGPNTSSSVLPASSASNWAFSIVSRFTRI